MFSKLVLFALFTSTASASNLPPVNNVLNVGAGRNSATPTLSLPVSKVADAFTIAASGGGATNAFYIFVKFDGSGGAYQVPAGKKAHCTNLRYASGSNSDGVIIGHSTAAATNGNTSAPTGAVYYSATEAAGNGPLSFETTSANASGGFQSMPLSIKFPAQKYPFLKVSASLNGAQFRVLLDCIEL